MNASVVHRRFRASECKCSENKSTEGHRGPAGEPVSSAFHAHRVQPAQSTPIAHPFGSGGSLSFFFSFVFCHPNDENVGREKKKKYQEDKKAPKTIMCAEQLISV